MRKKRNVSEKRSRENRSTHFIFNNFFLTRRLWDNAEKYRTVGQAANDYMTHAHCMLDNYGFKHTGRICSIYCSSTAKMVAGTRLNVTLYVHCLSCSNLFLQLKETNRLPDAVRTLPSYGKWEFFELLRNVSIQQCNHPWILVYDLRADLVIHKMGVSWTRCWRTSYVTSWNTDSRYPCTVL
jgi:hypothetical protein